MADPTIPPAGTIADPTDDMIAAGVAALEASPELDEDEFVRMIVAAVVAAGYTGPPNLVAAARKAIDALTVLGSALDGAVYGMRTTQARETAWSLCAAGRYAVEELRAALPPDPDADAPVPSPSS
jgi:hypothetical protein